MFNKLKKLLSKDNEMTINQQRFLVLTGKTIDDEVKFNGLNYYFEHFNEDGNQTYFEDSTGAWIKWVYNENGKCVYYENSNGDWFNILYNETDQKVYYQDSNDTWVKREYDSNGTMIKFDTSVK